MIQQMKHAVGITGTRTVLGGTVFAGPIVQRAGTMVGKRLKNVIKVHAAQIILGSVNPVGRVVSSGAARSEQKQVWL